MRLATILAGQEAKAVAVAADGRYVDIAATAAGIAGAAGDALRSGRVQTIIEAGPGALGALAAALPSAPASACHDPATVTLMAPIPAPAKNVFCVGRNYAAHIAEGDRAQKQNVGVSEHPVFFTKPLTAVIGHGAEIPIFPRLSTSIDYEVELAVVIGKSGRDIRPGDAMDHVMGVTILNDVTARDIQRRHGGQYFKGKALDGSCPIGPWIVTMDEIGDLTNLDIGCAVNGETRQAGNTEQLIFDIPTLIASLSEGLTLDPGDIIATGTPSGVGYAMDPPRFLGDGDVVTCHVEKIGTLENRCVSQ
ncbi:MAG: fumarylacetoacetate hydrolase family protein [Pseudomonadota bacterium]